MDAVENNSFQEIPASTKNYPKNSFLTTLKKYRIKSFGLKIPFYTICTFFKIPSVSKHVCFVIACPLRNFIVGLHVDFHQIVN